MQQSKQQRQALVQAPQASLTSAEPFFKLLSNPTPDPDLSDHHGWDHWLSSIFIQTPTYGTRCSTVVRVSAKNEVEFIEKTFYPKQQTSSQHHHWTL